MPRKDPLVEFERLAMEGVQRIRAFWNNPDQDAKQLNDARFGAIAIATYSRLRGTLANERALDLQEKNMSLPPKRG